MKEKMHTPAEMAEIRIKVKNHVADMLRLLEASCGISSVARGNPRTMTVTEWLSRQNISDADALAYPNARTAYEIKNSPLGKALE